MDSEAKKTCRTPTKGRDGTTNIPLWKYDAVRRAILDAVGNAGRKGMPFKNLPQAVRERLTEEERENLGSVSWHTTSVKLEMEVAGELKRLDQKGPQHLVLAQN